MSSRSDRTIGLYAVAGSWLGGFVTAGVWAIGQPLWYCVGITAVGVLCLPLMAAAVWVTKRDEPNAGPSDRSG
jgi:hypothetical protein